MCVYSQSIAVLQRRQPSALCDEYTSKSLWPHNASAVLCEGTLSSQPPSLKVEPGAGDFSCDRQARP